jgi:hypothetical protein
MQQKLKNSLRWGAVPIMGILCVIGIIVWLFALGLEEGYNICQLIDQLKYGVPKYKIWGGLGIVSGIYGLWTYLIAPDYKRTASWVAVLLFIILGGLMIHFLMGAPADCFLHGGVNGIEI